jgi:acyl-CoA thioester hydrolase
MIQFEYRTKVYYKDVDQMGIVYYARYYEYFEAARTELLKSLGIHVTAIEDDGYLLFHDFNNRTYYHGILKYYEIVDTVKTLAVLVKK